MKNNTSLIILICLFIVLFSTTIKLVNADDKMDLQISLNVSFESQNVMQTSYIMGEDDKRLWLDYWQYAEQIKNFYIKNEPTEIIEYDYKFDVTDSDNGRVIAYLVKNKNDASYYDVYLVADGIIYLNSDSIAFFGNMRKLDLIDNISGLDTSEVTTMYGMFSGTGTDSQEFTLDVSTFDTSKVTNMKAMFQNTGYSNPNFTLELGDKFDTSNVTDLSFMFNKTGYSSNIFELDISSFDTNKATTMAAMFQSTGYSNPNFTLDVSGLNTSNVTDMRSMFTFTGYNSTILALDVSNFDTSKVTDMHAMFADTGYSNPIFTLDVSNFDTSKVTNMESMFSYTGYNSTEFTLDVSNFDTSKVTNMSGMFRGAGYNNSNFALNVSNFNTSKVTTMYYMFADTGYKSTEFSIDLSNFDTNQVDNVEAMFYNLAVNSGNLNTSITISNPNISYYSLFLTYAFIHPDSQLRINYTAETEELVDKMLAAKSSNSNVVKGNLIVDVDNLSIGDEIHISGEKFNVISQTDDTITMLAQYNLGTDYRQSTDENKVSFSEISGWEYAPGPKEIDIQVNNGNVRKMVNNYVRYLQTQIGDTTISGGIITLKELKDLGCIIPSDYFFEENESGRTCKNSIYMDWLVNGQDWWTRSAASNYGYTIWRVTVSGNLYYNAYGTGSSVRPVITISKETLRGL